jgi:hypothetical protein
MKQTQITIKNSLIKNHLKNLSVHVILLRFPLLRVLLEDRLMLSPAF